jgi:hypothetical protein
MGDTRMDETEKEWMESWEACIPETKDTPTISISAVLRLLEHLKH